MLAQRFMNLFLHRFVQHSCAAFVTATLAAQADLQVARSRTPVFDFSRGRNPKAFLSRLVSFHFVHGTAILSQADKRAAAINRTQRKFGAGIVGKNARFRKGVAA